MPQTKRLDVLRATHVAIVYFRRLYRTGVTRIRIEEVEMTRDEKYWIVTIGYDVPGTMGATMMDTVAGRKPMPLREYKELKIEALTGAVEYMRIKKI